ncbi:MAG: hypothetical protein AAF708_03310 [Deinococcota bacterium]
MRAFLPSHVWRVSLIALLTLIGLLMTPSALNTYRFQRLRQSFVTQIQHPTESRVLAQASAFGLLSGAGNMCQYFVGHIIYNDDLEADALQTHYDAQQLTLPLSHHKLYIWVDAITTPQLSTYVSSLTSFDAWQLELPDDLSHHYLISVGYAEPEVLDWRCS